MWGWGGGRLSGEKSVNFKSVHGEIWLGWHWGSQGIGKWA